MTLNNNDSPRTHTISQRVVRFSILTPNPLISKKVTHDSEVMKYRVRTDERTPGYVPEYDGMDY